MFDELRIIDEHVSQVGFRYAACPSIPRSRPSNSIAPQNGRANVALRGDANQSIKSSHAGRASSVPFVATCRAFGKERAAPHVLRCSIQKEKEKQK